MVPQWVSLTFVEGWAPGVILISVVPKSSRLVWCLRHGEKWDVWWILPQALGLVQWHKVSILKIFSLFFGVSIFIRVFGNLDPCERWGSSEVQLFLGLNLEDVIFEASPNLSLSDQFGSSSGLLRLSSFQLLREFFQGTSEFLWFLSLRRSVLNIGLNCKCGKNIGSESLWWLSEFKTLEHALIDYWFVRTMGRGSWWDVKKLGLSFLTLLFVANSNFILDKLAMMSCSLTFDPMLFKLDLIFTNLLQTCFDVKLQLFEIDFVKVRVSSLP